MTNDPALAASEARLREPFHLVADPWSRLADGHLGGAPLADGFDDSQRSVLFPRDARNMPTQSRAHATQPSALNPLAALTALLDRPLLALAEAAARQDDQRPLAAAGWSPDLRQSSGVRDSVAGPGPAAAGTPTFSGWTWPAAEETLAQSVWSRTQSEPAGTDDGVKDQPSALAGVSELTRAMNDILAPDRARDDREQNQLEALLRIDQNLQRAAEALSRNRPATFAE